MVTSPQSNNNTNGNGTPAEEPWKCSDKQRGLILKLVDEHDLDKNEVEALAVERFGHGVRSLNKVEASGLIDELLDRHAPDNRNGRQRAHAGNGNGRGGRK